MNRRWRNLPTPVRQRRFDPPWPVRPTAPAADAIGGRTRVRPPFTRRGRYWVLIPPAQAPATAGAIPPAVRRQAPVRLLPQPRGRVWLRVDTPATAGSGAIAPVLRRPPPLRLSPPRRGRFWPLRLAGVSFVCQDLTAVVVVDAHSATAALDLHIADLARDEHSATVLIDAHSATVAFCGR